jgi:hypothetical protein
MTITLTREEAQQLLDALDGHSVYKVEAAIKFLRARLSAPECVCGEPYTVGVHRQDGPCYQQPEREWQGLTEHEKTLVMRRSVNRQDAVTLTETMLREKNT